MISIDPASNRPLYEQVVEGFRSLIVSGILAENDKLPSVRQLSSQLAINPNTIQRAYREMENLGYVYSMPGKGSFVSPTETAATANAEELLKEFDEIVDKLAVAGIGTDQLTERLKGGHQQ